MIPSLTGSETLISSLLPKGARKVFCTGMHGSSPSDQNLWTTHWTAQAPECTGPCHETLHSSTLFPLPRMLRMPFFNLINYCLFFATDWIVCVPPKFLCWNLIPNVIVFGDWAFGEWLRHKNSALVIEITESSLARTTMWEDHRLWTRKWVLKAEAESASALTLHFLASRTVRNKSAVFCYSTPNILETSSNFISSTKFSRFLFTK